MTWRTVKHLLFTIRMDKPWNQVWNQAWKHSVVSHSTCGLMWFPASVYPMTFPTYWTHLPELKHYEWRMMQSPITITRIAHFVCMFHFIYMLLISLFLFISIIQLLEPKSWIPVPKSNGSNYWVPIAGLRSISSSSWTCCQPNGETLRCDTSDRLLSHRIDWQGVLMWESQ